MLLEVSWSKNHDKQLTYVFLCIIVLIIKYYQYKDQPNQNFKGTGFFNDC